MLVSQKWDMTATRRFFTRALNTTTVPPVEVITDKAAVYPRVLNEAAPGAWHHTGPYANNRIEADHGQLKRRLRLMRSLKTDRGTRIIITGHGFVQNIRRNHCSRSVVVATCLGIAFILSANSPTCSGQAAEKPW